MALLRADRLSLDQLPPELRLEIVSYVGVHIRHIARLSSCSSKWRQFCLPLLFRQVVFSREFSNEAIVRFLIHNATRHGDLIHELCVEAFQSDGDPDDALHARWAGARDQLLASLLAFTPKLSSLHTRFTSDEESCAVPDALSTTFLVLHRAAHHRRLVLEELLPDDVACDYVVKKGLELDGRQN